MLSIFPRSNAGRFDNPKLYRSAYAARAPEAALGERFGSFGQWNPHTFMNKTGRYALATYEIPNDIGLCDLDIVRLLSRERMERVTSIVTRDRSVTQTLAEKIYLEHSYAGLAWWSAYYSDWSNVMLWTRAALKVTGRLELLSIGHAAVIDAAGQLPRKLNKS